VSEIALRRMPGFEQQRLSPLGLLGVIALHALVFWILLQMEIVRMPAPLAALTVDLIKPPEEIKPPEPPPPPKPRPIPKRPEPVQQPVQLAAPEDSPAPPSAITVPPPPAVIAPLPPVAPAPVRTVQPRFDADYLDNPKPIYPPLSRRMSEEGRVVLRVQVAANGLPTAIVIHTSSGSERLDRAAFDAVSRWRFVPARRGDEPIDASVLVPIVFSLKE